VPAPGFTIVRPDGRRLDRGQTLDGFFENLYASDPAVLRHDNVNVHPVLDTPGVCIVGYEEVHVYADHAVTNALTAVFLRDPSAPRGVAWLLVHETPVAGP